MHDIRKTSAARVGDTMDIEGSVCRSEIDDQYVYILSDVKITLVQYDGLRRRKTMKKIDVKFVLKGLIYVGLITMIIIMMMIASSCSAEPKPEMSQEEAANLTDSIREEISGHMCIQ